MAENVGTATGTWLYPGRATAGSSVSLQKLGSWYLLLTISFVLVTLVNRPRPPDAQSPSAEPATGGAPRSPKTGDA